VLKCAVWSHGVNTVTPQVKSFGEIGAALAAWASMSGTAITAEAATTAAPHLDLML